MRKPTRWSERAVVPRLVSGGLRCLALETAKTDVNNAIGLAGPRYFREFHGSAWSHGGSTTRLL